MNICAIPVQYANGYVDLIFSGVEINIRQDEDNSWFFYCIALDVIKRGYNTRDGAQLAAERWYADYVEEDSRR